MTEDPRYLCETCLSKGYRNQPHKKQQLARCHGCDEIIVCSEFEARVLKPQDQEPDLPWSVMFEP